MYTKNITLCRQISRFQIIRLTKYPRKLIREWKSKSKSFNPLFPPTRQYPIYYFSSFRTYHLRRTSVTTPAFHTLGILTPSRASWKFPASVRRDVRAGGGQHAWHFADSAQTGPGLACLVWRRAVWFLIGLVLGLGFCTWWCYIVCSFSLFCEVIFEEDISVVQCQTFSSSFVKQVNELDNQLFLLLCVCLFHFLIF